MKFHSEEPDG